MSVELVCKSPKPVIEMKVDLKEEFESSFEQMKLWRIMTYK